jgi:glyoxylase-like metal-dependent hydrolase (beta-lactamase superfamily II)
MKRQLIVSLSLGLMWSSLVTSAVTAGSSASPNVDDNLTLQQVTENVYGIVGPLHDRTASNLGNNATFGFVVTYHGVVLIDPGGSYKGAKRIQAIIHSVTEQPVRVVINTGGEDHRWLGNDYFKSQGAIVIASAEAVEDQKARFNEILMRLGNTVGDGVLQGARDSYADITFDKEYRFSMGGDVFEIYHPGNAHSPGDSFVWLPQQNVMFAGDIACTDRKLSLMWYSQSKSWIEAYEAMASFKPVYVIPGHGKPTTLEVTDRDTYDYLTTLRKAVAYFMVGGGGIEEVNKLDQLKFRYLVNYEALKNRNAQKVYEEIEFE